MQDAEAKTFVGRGRKCAFSPAYTKAVREDLPNSVLVCDRFHIMQMLHRTITDCRRTIYRKLPDETARRAIKGSRFILLKRRSGLDP
ncbi:MAG: transposase, partial [Thermoguttaceae bacterium]|nr:transposase [Thermoguttaceae bacterium]